MKRWLFAAVAAAAAIVLAGCAGGPAAAPEELPPPGTERLTLENGAYAIFRFDLPPGTTWGDFDRLTAEYMVDAANMRIPQRNASNVRLMGPYREEYFEAGGRTRQANLNENFNAPFIMDDTPRTFASMGAVADEWFTVTYDISGASAHAQFSAANIPAPGATGPFFFGIGIPSQAEFRGITQYVRNVTLHHASDPALNVVSTGSGFEEPTFASFMPVMSRRISGPPVPEEPVLAAEVEAVVPDGEAYTEAVYY